MNPVRKYIRESVNKLFEQAQALRDLLTQISKKTVMDVGEELNCEKEGKCADISFEIKKRLDALNIDSDVIQVLSGKVVGDTHPTDETHYYVMVYGQNDENLIIDTQLWQIEKQPTNLDKRQTVFSYEEYNKFFQPHETQKVLAENAK